MMKYPIRNLGIIGDRRTAAVIDRRGDICWYCPGQFDSPSLFASLLDQHKGGGWHLELPQDYRVERRYLGKSSILESRFHSDNDSFVVTDWMPMDEYFTGICRLFSPGAFPVTNNIIPAPGYGQQETLIRKIDTHSLAVNDSIFMVFSHPPTYNGRQIIFTIPAGEEGWAILSDKEIKGEGRQMLDDSLQKTQQKWETLHAGFSYEGPFQDAVFDSLRAIQQLTHEPSGGIIAAITTSLPEVLGGERNYDYRYVWLRDASMIVSAITRAGSMKKDALRFLDFICSARGNIRGYATTPFVTLDKKAASSEQYLDFEGYAGSRPVRVGNNANEQLQLDAGSNILLAAKLIYGKYNTRQHWNTIEEIAEFLVGNWQKEDNGIWEEHVSRQFTSSKVIMAVALEYISEYSESVPQQEAWRQAARDIREFVSKECITPSGSYAVYAGSEDVDVTATLFPEWGYCPAGTPEMVITVEELEARYCRNNLVYRNLLLFDSRQEGAFLAASFWMAQYWIMRGNQQKSKEYIEAALRYKNDLGLFAEEADPDSDDMLGNFPQSFVHASFIGAAVDYKNAFGGRY